ncbi:MAG TPA: DNA topoisomerase, partial [Candidatus Ozemobacteraceae bacterium]|nr:DNA topoisomerase [Candidatus Ozemobacteraceae bacterium]
MKHLVFAEKPSVARDIARVLGARQRANGYFEGEHWIVTWGVGHLISLAEPGEQNPSWSKWNLQALPMLPDTWKLKVLEQTAAQFAIVKALMGRPDVADIVNAADAGREGELIFRYVYEAAAAAKPTQRLWISSMTDEAIKQGFKSLKPGKDFDNLGQAARCRSIADWLIGMNGTRGYTKKFNTMLTVGRVQTPTLAMVVKRQLEIEAFKPEPYWEITVRLDDFQAQWFDPKHPEKENAARLLDRKKAEAIVALLKGLPAVVTRTRSETKKIPPPLLYDLTTLQREANRFFGLTAAQTLQIVQTLYEQRKVVTYPRTDSQHLSDDLHATIPDRLKALPSEYQLFTRELSQQPIPKNKRVFDNAKVSDHHAIIPTEKPAQDIRSWKPDEQKIYDLIARRF